VRQWGESKPVWFSEIINIGGQGTKISRPTDRPTWSTGFVDPCPMQ